MHFFHGLLISIIITTSVANAQKYSDTLLNIGDHAPQIRVKNWLKGTPVSSFEKGMIYVIEFWATWCRPCKAEMPHLSRLARKYKDCVIVLGIDIYEAKTMSLNSLKTFVDSMDENMGFNVGVADSNYMVNDWLGATGQINKGIPTAFIVDREGRLAWMGHPCHDFEEALSRIVSNTWDISKALSKRKFEFRLKNLDSAIGDKLEFGPDGNFRSEKWKQDSSLLLVDEEAKTNPLVKYTPKVAYQLFSTLLNTNTTKAFEYGKKVLETPTYEEPASSIIIWCIENISREIKLPPQIYKLGIQAIQTAINEALSCYPEIKNIYKLYNKKAEWYWRLGNKIKAIGAQEKAIENMKSKYDYQETDLKDYEAQLRKFKKM